MTRRVSQSNGLIVLTQQLTVQAAAYDSGDLIGGKIDFGEVDEIAGMGGRIVGVTVVDQAKQGANLDVLFFDDDPSATTFTENAALDIADADMAKLIGFLQVTSYSAQSDNTVGRGEADRPLPFILAGKRLYGAVIGRATPTFAATSDVILRVAVERG